MPSKETVRRAYIAEIGYDCFADCPAMTVDEAWEIVLDCRAYHAGELPAPDAFQTRADVDCDPDAGPYPGWTSMQSALQYND
jgi:hypothetical protein